MAATSRVVSRVVMGSLREWLSTKFFPARPAGETGNCDSFRSIICQNGSLYCHFDHLYRQAREAPMDTLDQQLIAQLRSDARASVATLAHRLGVSRGTVN